MTAEITAFYSAYDDFERWREALAREGVDLHQADAIDHPDRVRHALVWKPPHGFFSRFQNLGLVVNLGAGVDALIGRDDLPDLPITRLSDPKMARMMAGYVLFAVMRHAREIPKFEDAQRKKHWQYIHPRDPESITVGVLGLGELGMVAALECTRQGYRVLGWSNTLKTIEGVATSAGPFALKEVLGASDIVVCMQPHTLRTCRLIDGERFAQMKRGVAFINVSRGTIVDEPALIEALRSGHVGEATLDVFATEPLPADNPLWTIDKVLVTPHLASVASPESAARQIGENVRRLREGVDLLNRVDPSRGY